MKFSNLNNKLNENNKTNENNKIIKEEKIKDEKPLENLKTGIISEKEEDVKFSIKREKKDLNNAFIINEDERKVLIEKGKEVYSQALDLSRELISFTNNPYIEIYTQITYIVEKLYLEIKENPFFVQLINYLTPSNYLHSHNVNMAIISMGTAISLGLDKSKVNLLGVVSFFHDLGIIEYLDIIKAERVLTLDEREIIKQHSVKGVQILDKVVDLDFTIKEEIARLILSIHERSNGSGYPYNLKGEQIDDLSSILAISDVYEAMTHKRNYREAYEQPLVMRMFINEMRKDFNPTAIKGLISFLGMYPIMSLVKLSNNQIAQVILLNKNNFTRPIVKILLDENFKEIVSSYLDLMEYPLTSIEEEVSYDKLAKENPNFYSSFEMNKFWLDW